MKVQVDGLDDVFDTHTGDPTGPEHLHGAHSPGAAGHALIRDRDTTFVSSFGAVLAAEGIRIINLPIRTARANTERFVGTA